MYKRGVSGKRSDKSGSDKKSTNSGSRVSGSGYKKPFGKSTKDEASRGDKPPRRTKSFNEDKPGARGYSNKKPASGGGVYGERREEKPERGSPRKPASYGENRKPAGRFSNKENTSERRNAGDRETPKSYSRTRSFEEKPARGKYNTSDSGRGERAPAKKADGTFKSRSGRGPAKSDLLFDKRKAQKDDKPQTGNIRLNRYIANAGICSRREADDLILAGVVTVNGKAVEEMGYQVKPNDEVRYNGQLLSREKKVYLLLNKPKDAITTFEDPEGRRTVMELFGNELGERIYPVGRLDRNTTGVLLFTNDGDVAQRLTHPRYEMTKVYKATLDKNFKGEDLWQLQNGVELEDGFIKPDGIAIPDPKNKNEVGVEIHSGKNRIIHRMFEHLGYKVDKLDRALYAGLTKGKLKRGEWRHLTEKEVNTLKRTLKLS